MTESATAAVHPLRIPGFGSPLCMQVHAMADVHVSAAIARDGIWEPQETRFLLDTLRPGDVFVDVGANIGYFSLLASRLAAPGIMPMWSATTGLYVTTGWLIPL